jgi:AraC-like DNA-binding protein
MDFEPTLSPRFVAYVRDYLMDRGIQPDPVFAEAGISSTKDEEYDAPIPVQQVATLFEAAARYSDNPCMGMNMAQQYHYESSSLLILAMVAAPSVGEGIKCLNRYDKYVDTGIETSFEFGQPVAEFGARILVDGDVKVDQLNEYLMTFTVQALSMATRKQMPLTEVWFCHHSDQNERALQQFFGAPVKFSRESNKLLFDRSFLQERFFSSNTLLYDILINALKTYFSSVGEQGGFVDVVCREITRLGGDEIPSTEIIAARLAISPRTLRRRLSEEGYSFQEAKNLAREKRAKYYLSQTNMPLSEIAFELGFSELSAFSRAFRSWVGETPQSYRENYKQLLRA